MYTNPKTGIIYQNAMQDPEVKERAKQRGIEAYKKRVPIRLQKEFPMGEDGDKHTGAYETY